METLHNLFINKNYDLIIDFLYDNKLLENLTNLKLTNSNLKLSNLEKKVINDDKYKKEFLKRLVNFISRKKSNETLFFKKKYFIIIANTELLTKLFILFTYSFLSTKTQFIGIDLEFNTGKIALTQISFFPHNKKFNYIWILSPPLISSSFKPHVINNVFINQKIFKIVHGADALDFPYLLHTFLENNSLWIMNFIQKTMETRYLCECIKLIKKEEDKKCSIYDALLYFNVIDQEKYDELTIINKQMIPIEEHKNWDINQMSQSKIFYAANDVVYLKDLLFSMIHNINDGLTYYKLNASIFRMITMDKYDVIDLIKESKKLVDPLNNYLVPEKNTTLIKMFNEHISKIFIEYPKLDINIIINIDYYRKSIMILIKRIMYHLILNKYKVNVNKFYEYRKKISIIEMFEVFKEFKLDILTSFFNQILNELKKVI